MSSGDELFAVLLRLRDAARGSVPRDRAREQRDWRALEAFVRRTRSGQGSDADDVTQDTLIAIARHVADLDARDASGALSWVLRIARNKKIDLTRLRAREGRRAEAHDAESSAVDALERDDGRPVDERALSMLVELVEEGIAAHVDALSIPAADKQLKRTQARATLHRVLGDSTAELAAVLALPAGFGSDRLAKWVERGRPLLSTVLEEMVRQHDGDAVDVLEALRAAVLARRADAGVARPGRRKLEGAGE